MGEDRGSEVIPVCRHQLRQEAVPVISDRVVQRAIERVVLDYPDPGAGEAAVAKCASRDIGVVDGVDLAGKWGQRLATCDLWELLFPEGNYVVDSVAGQPVERGVPVAHDRERGVRSRRWSNKL